MATYEVGQTIQWGLTVTDSTGALVDPGTTPTATVTLPDGTTTSATVTRTSTGLYTATVVASLAGRYRIHWASSGTNSGGFPYTDAADAWPADPRFIISLADARAALNLPTTATTNDDEIRLYIASATEVIEDIIGPVLSATKVETVSGRWRQCIPLCAYPTAITSVVEDAVTLAASSYSFDESGILWRGAYPGAGCWSGATPRNVAVTYTVGAGIIPPGVIKAARELVKHQYSVSQQAVRPQFDDGGPSYAEPSGWFAVLDSLKPHVGGKVPGFA